MSWRTVQEVKACSDTFLVSEPVFGRGFGEGLFLAK